MSEGLRLALPLSAAVYSLAHLPHDVQAQLDLQTAVEVWFYQCVAVLALQVVMQVASALRC